MVRVGDTVNNSARGAMKDSQVQSVFVNGQKAVTKGSVTKDFSSVKSVSSNVFIEGSGVARLGDKTSKGVITGSSPDVFVNGFR